MLLKVLKTIQFINKKTYEKFCFKKINNIIIFILDINRFIYYNKHYVALLKNFFTYSFILFYFRIIWRGKAYRVRLFKKRKRFTFNFGHSHWYKMWYDEKYFTFFRLKRQSYLVIFGNRKLNFIVSEFFNNIRFYNHYTRRGIRLKKTFYKKRFGKISQVNSILHSF